MSILNKLASALERRDEVPNQELARRIADKNDSKAVKELVDNLLNKNKDIHNDCIKVLYEIGELKPSLIAGYVKDFIALLNHKNNRLQWGAMAALDKITLENPKLMYANLSKIIDAMEKGSVITKDSGVNILIKLCSLKEYASDTFSLLLEQLVSSPTNQLPMYAERALPAINEKTKTAFIKVLTSRLGDIEKDTKRKRVENVIKKLSKK
jgi:hypothetical protein